jgi:hypothetical protein
VKCSLAWAAVVVSIITSAPGFAADQPAARPTANLPAAAPANYSNQPSNLEARAETIGSSASTPAPATKIKATNNNDEPPELSVPGPVAVTPTALPLLPLPPAAPSALITLKQRPGTHRFFDRKNSFALGAAAISLTADAVSTQQGLSYPGFYEVNPVARPFVKTRAGAAVYSAGSLGLLAGAMYLAHRTHHHRLERVLPFALAGWEGLLSARNYRVISSRPR